jgi:hypothetical protein
MLLLPVLLLPVSGCTQSAERTARQDAEPEAVAAAVCREVRTGEAAGCETVRLTDRASEIAYATCLDYNRRDPRACDRLRRAFEGDVRAQIAAQTAGAGAEATAISEAERRRAAGGLKTGEQQPPAEALYKAANSDADTFQAALLIPEVRKKVEAALGKQLSDAQLRALVDNNRAEAVYWYDRMRHSTPARRTVETRPGG